MHNLRLELEERFPEVEFVPVIGDIRLPNRLISLSARSIPKSYFTPPLTNTSP